MKRLPTSFSEYGGQCNQILRSAKHAIYSVRMPNKPIQYEVIEIEIVRHKEEYPKMVAVFPHCLDALEYFRKVSK